MVKAYSVGLQNLALAKSRTTKFHFVASHQEMSRSAWRTDAAPFIAPPCHIHPAASSI